MRLRAALITLCAAFALCYAQAAMALPAMVKVKLFSSQPQVEKVFVRAPLVVHGSGVTRLSGGRYVLSTDNGGIVLRRSGGARAIVARGKSIVLESPSQLPISLTCAEQAAPHLYKGKLVIAPSGSGGITVVNEVDCKSYIASCVGSECPPGFAPEALKAQAVLCSTLLDGNLRGTKLLQDSTEDQSYLGASAERAGVRQAVDAVFGQELFYGPRPIRVYYSSTCGGKTSTPVVFGGKYDASRYPYLKAVNCKFCAGSPFAHDLVKTATVAELQSKAGISSIAVKQNLDGRPLKVSVGKNRLNESWSGYQLFLAMGRAFGWGFLPSTRFAVARDGQTYRFTSRGCGHGVGLCQWGADGQARVGKGYDQILQFYFPGTRIKVLGGANQPVVKVSLGK